MYNCDWAGCNHVSAAVTEVKRHRRKHLIDEKQLVKCKADMQAMFDAGCQHYIIQYLERVPSSTFSMLKGSLLAKPLIMVVSY